MPVREEHPLNAPSPTIWQLRISISSRIAASLINASLSILAALCIPTTCKSVQFAKALCPTLSSPLFEKILTSLPAPLNALFPISVALPVSISLISCIWSVPSILLHVGRLSSSKSGIFPSPENTISPISSLYFHDKPSKLPVATSVLSGFQSRTI